MECLGSIQCYKGYIKFCGEYRPRETDLAVNTLAPFTGYHVIKVKLIFKYS